MGRRLSARTRFPSQHPQECDWVLQRFWLDDLCDLPAVPIDDDCSFVAEEIFDRFACVVEYTHGSRKKETTGCEES